MRQLANGCMMAEEERSENIIIPMREVLVVAVILVVVSW